MSSGNAVWGNSARAIGALPLRVARIDRRRIYTSAEHCAGEVRLNHSLRYALRQKPSRLHSNVMAISPSRMMASVDSLTRTYPTFRFSSSARGILSATLILVETKIKYLNWQKTSYFDSRRNFKNLARNMLFTDLRIEVTLSNS